ncbi:MAG TPA: hypothetical protein VM598_04030 [Bdellovibrionota bacterium]|nr:hypothetical protein [Bdellovibrionota bacterium]
MQIALLAVAFFACDSGAAEPRQFKAEWTSCRRDLDCVAIKGTCDEWACVNGAYQKKAQEFYEEAMQYTECLPVSPTIKPRAQCIRLRCKC